MIQGSSSCPQATIDNHAKMGERRARTAGSCASAGPRTAQATRTSSSATATGRPWSAPSTGWIRGIGSEGAGKAKSYPFESLPISINHSRKGSVALSPVLSVQISRSKRNLLYQELQSNSTKVPTNSEFSEMYLVRIHIIWLTRSIRQSGQNI